ncbi:MAG TPA: hypothetical protein VG826_13970 [Pirellulales bacterium]|nr:hypothetical protein [Pirellulales bacterium]
MTDDRLIELIAQQPARELTNDELAAIRARLAVSPALRESIRQYLQLEQALHQSVAQFRLPVELLLAKAAAMQATSTVAKLFGWGSLAGLLIGMATVGTLVSLRDQPQPIEKVAIDEPASPSDQAPDESGGVARAGGRQVAAAGRQVARLAGAAEGMREAATDLYFSDDGQAAAWRQSLESFSGEVSQRRIGERVELVLRGAQVLKSELAWPASGRMRMTLADHDRFKIHLSSSLDAAAMVDVPEQPPWPAWPSSLTLEYFARPEPLWVAWVAAQRANQTLPETLALAAHDGGTASRLKAATIDVGYRRGEIVVTHGETELLAAPLAGPPDRIVFEGDAVVRGLAFAEGVVSTADRATPSLIAAASPPSERDWKCELPTGSTWSTLAAGRVELFAEDSRGEARAACSLGEVQEVCVQLEDPLFGTGIYLSDERGEIRYRLSFMPGRKTNQVCFAASAGAAAPPELPDGPAPLCPARPWFRLVVTDGVVKAWFSCNGAHWSPVLGPAPVVEGRITTAGVYCLAGPGTRSIRVTRFAGLCAEPREPQAAGELFGRAEWRLRPSRLLRWAGQRPAARYAATP